MTTDTYRFLKLFRQDDEKVILGLLHENKNEEPTAEIWGLAHLEMEMQHLNAPLGNWIGFYKNRKIFINTYNRRDGHAVFFMPNPGGTKNKEINDIRAWFIDLDFAKIKEEYNEENRAIKRQDELHQTGDFDFLVIEPDYDKKKDILKYILHGRYTQEKIKQFKESYMKKHRGALQDAVIVDTYAGYHAYWIAKNGSKENFKKIQRALIRKFGSDNQIVKEAGFLRLPGFQHRKYEDPYPVEVIQWSDKSFTEEELMHSLNLNLIEQQKGFVKKEVDEPISYSSDLTRSVTVIQRKKQSDLIFKNVVPFGKFKNQTFNEALQTVLGEPLTAFIESPDMEIGENISCPFHNDQHPSASVFISKTGEMLFKCHACTIGARNIIGLYMVHTGMGWRNSVKNLAKMIGVKVVETEFEREQFTKYRDNRHFLNQDLETILPNTEHFIGKYGRTSYLRYFNDKAELNVVKEEFQYKGHNVFFISYRAIAKEMGGKNMQSVQNTVVLLNALGFLERVPEEFIPTEMKQRAERERKILQAELRQQGEKGEKRAGAVRLINFYIVPSWNDIAYQIEQRATTMNEQKYSVMKHNNKIAIENMLGAEVAQSVFPDGRKMPGRFETILERLKNEVESSIKEKGFVVAEEVCRVQIRIKGVVVPLSEKEDVMKRALFIHQDYQIVKIRSAQKKKEYGYAQKTPTTIHVIKKK